MDIDAANELAQLADVEIETLARNMFEAGSDFDEKTEEEILNQDFKIFYSGDIAFGVSQISAMGQGELDKVRERIEKHLPAMCVEKKVQMIFVMLTDIMEERTTLMFYGNDAAAIAKDAFKCEMSDGAFILENVVSRKKQLIPALMNAFTERMF